MLGLKEKRCFPWCHLQEAIKREKAIKGKSRNYKIDLINKFNPKWTDLYEEIEIGFD
jgi:predicted GIY-YIG superfamily endonuclease